MSHEARAGHVAILIGLLCGAGLGWAANALGHGNADAQRAVAAFTDAVAHPIGQVFLRLLFVVVVPLVFASLATGVAALGSPAHLGRVGLRTLAFFLATSGLSVVLALVVMGFARPGGGFDPAVRDELVRSFGSDLQRVQAAAPSDQTRTLLGTVNLILDAALPRNVIQAVTQMQMLPLIVLALLCGFGLSSLPSARARPALELLEIVADVMVRIVGLAMKLAPLAVACLMFNVTARFGGEILAKLALFVLCVVGSYLIQLFVFYPALLGLLARRNPWSFLRGALPVIVTAFSTSSSSATLPTSIRVAREDLGVRPEVAGFVLPLGATMNMNGTALFEGAVLLFVAQVFGIHLTLGAQALALVLCVLSSIGAAGVPGGSLPLLMIVMGQVGVPPEGIAIVLGVDRLLDMGRTVINVMGDLVCAAWIEHNEERMDARGVA